MEEEDFAEDLQENLSEEKDLTSEKMIPESRVTELIKKAKRQGERKMQDQLEAAKQQLDQLQGSQQQSQQMQSQGSPQGMPPELQQHVMDLISKQREQEEQKRHSEQLEQEVNQVAQQFFGKMSQGKDLFDDFEAVTADFNPAEFPQLVFLANQTDNTAAIIYELRKNPGKLADLAVLVERSPSMARSEIAKLSQSIKRNDEAMQNLQEPKDPLSRLKPSQAGTGTGSSTRSIRDLKALSSLRG